MQLIKPLPYKLTEEYITEYADVVDWSYVSILINLPLFSDEFFHRFHQEIDWENIRYNSYITTSFAHKYEEYIGAKCWFFMGKHHRHDDEPAVIKHDGTKEWWHCGKRHRLKGPAIVLENGTKAWLQNNKYHRDNDLPAIEFFYGEKKWYKKDKLHRENGPAVIHSNGSEEWYMNGKKHREGGPASVWRWSNKNEDHFYFLNGEQLLKGEYNFKLFKLKFKKKINSIFEFLKLKWS